MVDRVREGGLPGGIPVPKDVHAERNPTITGWLLLLVTKTNFYNNFPSRCLCSLCFCLTRNGEITTHLPISRGRGEAERSNYKGEEEHESSQGRGWRLGSWGMRN